LEYVPSCATAVGTTSAGMGMVNMAADYDVMDSTFLSKRAMDAAEYSTSGVPYIPQCHPIECAPRKNVLDNYFVTSSTTFASLPARADPRFYFPADFTLAVSGQQTSTDTIGELWITYDVILSRPTLEPAADPTEFGEHIIGAISSAGGISEASASFTGVTMNWGYTSGTHPTVYISPASEHLGGRYLILMRVTGTGTVAWSSATNLYPSLGGSAAYVNDFVQLTAGVPLANDTSWDGAGNTTALFGQTPNVTKYTTVLFTTLSDSIVYEVPYNTNGASAFEFFITPWSDIYGEIRPSERGVKPRDGLVVVPQTCAAAASSSSSSSGHEPPGGAGSAAACAIIVDQDEVVEAYVPIEMTHKSAPVRPVVVKR
jgi:hypothetical protein